MLWKQELHEAAVTSLQEHVIEPLTDMLLSSESKAAHPSNTLTMKGSRMTAAQNLLSEAFRSTGEWVAARRSRSGLTVLRQYLEPAVALASPCQREQQVKTHLTLATWHLHMHQTVQARVASLEWKQGQQLGVERKEEYNQCKRVTKELQTIYTSLGGQLKTKNSKPKPAPPMTPELAAAQQKFAQANRHLSVLMRELTIDAKEREEVEMSVQSHLVQSLDHYRSVLVLSASSTSAAGSVSADTVFHVIHLWFNSAHDPEVNAIMQDIIRRAPSFHFVSLHYQIMSRLDGSAAERALLSAEEASCIHVSRLKRTSPAGFNDQVMFQNTLTEMLFKLGKEHPYHILPQLFALMHDKLTWENINSYAAAVDHPSISQATGGGRIVAARSILHAVKRHFHRLAHGRELTDSRNRNSSSSSGASSGNSKNRRSSSVAYPYTHLVEGMDILLVQYVKLALTNMDKFIQSKRTKNLRFNELGVRGDTAFHECLNGVQMQRPGQDTSASSSSSSSSSSSVKKTKKRSSGGSVGSDEETSHLVTTTLHTADFHQAVVTKHLRVLPDARYVPWLDSAPSSSFCSAGYESNDITFVHGFSPEFSLTDDGLSRPKIIKCLGSDGRRYTQLVKGGDDTRQDSVMEQVWGSP